MTVSLARIRGEFERLWPYLDASLAYALPTHRKEDVLDAIERGEAILWPLPEAAVITTQKAYPSGLKVLWVWIAGGRLDQIKTLFPILRDVAATNGCRFIAAEGRQGWGRFAQRRYGAAWVEEIE